MQNERNPLSKNRIFSWKYGRRLATKFVVRWNRNGDATAAAAIAFFVLFSFAQIFVFSVTVAGYFLDASNEAAGFEQFLQQYVGQNQAEVIVLSINTSAFGRKAILPTILSIAIMVWSSSSMFIKIRMARNRIHGFAAETLKGSLLAVLLGRIRATVFALGIGLVLAFGAIFSAWSHTRWVSLPIEFLITNQTQRWIAEQFVSWVIVLLVFMTMLRYLPMRRPAWKIVACGACIATVLFQIGKYTIAAVAEQNLIASAYGPGSFLVVTVLWVFLSAHILLFAAEVGQLIFDDPHEEAPDNGSVYDNR